MNRTLALAAMTFALLATAPSAAAAGKIDRLVTPSGIEVWHVFDRTLPLVSVEFAFRGGASQDPADKAGVATLTSALLTQGAADLDARAFQERLEERAITLSFNAYRDTLRGSLRTLAENAPAAFDLLRLALSQPRFDAPEVERLRAGLLAGLRRRSTDPNDVASDRWFARAFPGHPYGRPSRGSLDTVPKIAVEDLRAYHRRTFARSNLKVAVVGAIEANALVALVDRAFGPLPATAELAPVPEVVPQTGQNEVIEFDVPQTAIVFGGPGLKRADPDFIPAFVLNHILGGGSFSSRLYREVRERRGLAYSVYSQLAPMMHAGLFLGGVSTRNDRAAESLRIIVDEIKRLAAEGPTAEELAKAKSYLTGSYALRFDTSGKIAGQLLEIQFESLGIDYIDRRNGLIAAVTAEDVRRAARRFLADAKLSATLVGRPDPAPPAGSRG